LNIEGMTGTVADIVKFFKVRKKKKKKEIGDLAST